MRTQPIPTLAATGLLATLALPGAATADGTTTASPGAGGGFLLQAGHDYALIGISDQPDTVDLLDPGGRVVATIGTNADLGHGAEFRAGYSARYFLRDHDPSSNMAADVVADCRGDARTLCPVSINHEKTGWLTWPDDQDWRSIRLARGITYGFTASGPGGACATIVDAQGRALSPRGCDGESASYRAPATGTYFLKVATDNPDEGAGYSVVVRAK